MSGNKKIKTFIKKLNKVKENNDCIIVMTNETGLDTTKAVYIDYVGERWAKGHSNVYFDGELKEVPETINYSDIFTLGIGVGKEFIFPEYIDGEVSKS